MSCRVVFAALLLGVGAGWYVQHETSKQIWDANHQLSDTLHRAITGKPLVSIQSQHAHTADTQPVTRYTHSQTLPSIHALLSCSTAAH